MIRKEFMPVLSEEGMYIKEYIEIPYKILKHKNSDLSPKMVKWTSYMERK